MSLSRLFSPFSWGRRGLCLTGKACQRSQSTDSDEGNKPRILITGGLGQLGSGLAKIMR